MRPVSSLLDRFRRAAAVPAAAGEELEAELLPVFAALEEIEDEARRVREDAARRAEARVAAAEQEAARSLARWARRAESERARVEAEHRRAAGEESQAIEAAARAEAEDLRARGRERLPALVAEVVACVRSAATPDAPPPSDNLSLGGASAPERSRRSGDPALPGPRRPALGREGRA